MLKSPATVNQPSVSTIKLNLCLRYLMVGRFLHGMTMVALAIFFLSLQKVDVNFQTLDFSNIFWFFLMLFGSSVALISQLDAYGRFQNYKQIKDKFCQYGVNTKLVRPFMFSKCQRDAILVAAKDFNRVGDVKVFFENLGYRWYHILPDICLKNPFVVFKKDFWIKILFTKYYQLQNYYW